MVCMRVKLGLWALKENCDVRERSERGNRRLGKELHDEELRV
jgi:hypothetical protein